MKIINDFEGRSIRLTEERLEHILMHPEMFNFIKQIDETIQNPEYVIQAKTDVNVKLYLKYYITKQFGGKFLCVVVKFSKDDAFIITSYLIRDLPKGEFIWQKS